MKKLLILLAIVHIASSFGWWKRWNRKGGEPEQDPIKQDDWIVSGKQNGKNVNLIVDRETANDMVANPNKWGLSDVVIQDTVRKTFTCGVPPEITVPVEPMSLVADSPACGCCLPDKKPRCPEGENTCSGERDDFIIYYDVEANECRMRCHNKTGQSIDLGYSFKNFDYLLCNDDMKLQYKEGGNIRHLGGYAIACTH